MSKRPGLLGAGSEVCALHHSPIGARGAERNSVPLIVGAHSNEIGAPSDLSLEMEDVRWFRIWSCRLMMIAEFIEPRKRIRVGTPVVREPSSLGRAIFSSCNFGKQ